MQAQTKRNRKRNPVHREQKYEVGKITFIVTPVYREDSDKTIHDILLDLMKKDGENA